MSGEEESYEGEIVDNEAPAAKANGHTSNAAPQAGQTSTQSFGSTAITAAAETAISAVAAQARAIIEARYVMALQRPRDFDEVRTRILKECKRPRFADVARYLKPVGKGIEGPSIRFAEAALRCMGNATADSAVIYEDARKRIIRVTVTDLESNLPYSNDIMIEKTVERSKVRDGQVVVSTRTNTYGKTVYIVEATEDDLLNKQNALVSKSLRTLILRILPGDILEEAMDQVVATQRDRDAKDPDEARKRMVDAFSALGVKPSDLKQWLGHDIGTSSPAELADLRAVYAAIREGETNWKDSLEHRMKGSAPSTDDKPKTAKEKVAEKAKANAKAKEAPKSGPDAAEQAAAEEALGKQEREPGQEG